MLMLMLMLMLTLMLMLMVTLVLMLILMVMLMLMLTLMLTLLQMLMLMRTTIATMTLTLKQEQKMWMQKLITMSKIRVVKKNLGGSNELTELEDIALDKLPSSFLSRKIIQNRVNTLIFYNKQHVFRVVKGLKKKSADTIALPVAAIQRAETQTNNMKFTFLGIYFV